MIFSFDPSVLLLPGECEKKKQRRKRSVQATLAWARRNPDKVRANALRSKLRKPNYHRDRYAKDPERAKEACRRHRANMSPDKKAAFAKIAREKALQWRVENREEYLAQTRAWRAKNKDSIRAKQKAWLDAHPNYQRDKRLEDPSYQSRYTTNRKKVDPAFRILCNLKRRMGLVLDGQRKADTSRALVGCSAEELRAYLESKFLPGMSWALRDRIHLDHIRPCASFDLTDPSQQRACFHYTNLQPLWAIDNLRKGSKWIPPLTPA